MRYEGPRRRNSLRYPQYDYAQPGAIFVTICTSDRQHLFGAVNDARMVRSPAGEVVADRWQAIPSRYPDVAMDAFVVMPDHLHGILICGANPDDEALRTTVGKVVRWFKTSVNRAYRTGVEAGGWPPYDRQLWQRDYWDRIVRTGAELDAYRAYIEANPGRWWEKHGGEL